MRAEQLTMRLSFWSLIFACVTNGVVAKAILPETDGVDRIRTIEDRLAKVEEELKLEKDRNFQLTHGLYIVVFFLKHILFENRF